MCWKIFKRKLKKDPSRHQVNEASIDVLEKEESETISDSQRLSDEQINQIITQLHEEKVKNSEYRQSIEQLQAKILEKDEMLKSLNEKTVLNDAEALKDNEENTNNVEEPLANDDQQGSMIQQLKTISDLLDIRIKELVEDRKELLSKLEDKNSHLEDLISRVQEDRYRKDKVKILRRNINMRNIINSVLEEYRQDNPRMDGYDMPAAIFLEQQLEKIIEKLDADLRQEMLIPLVKGLEGTDFDAEHQEIVERQPTDRPELDGKVYRSVAPGYVWTLPYIFKPRVNETGDEIYTYKFLLRSEDVITYEYIKKEQ